MGLGRFDVLAPERGDLSVCTSGAEFHEQKGRRNRPMTDADKAMNRTKSQVRAKVEHPFHMLEWVFVAVGAGVALPAMRFGTCEVGRAAEK